MEADKRAEGLIGRRDQQAARRLHVLAQCGFEPIDRRRMTLVAPIGGSQPMGDQQPIQIALTLPAIERLELPELLGGQFRVRDASHASQQIGQ